MAARELSRFVSEESSMIRLFTRPRRRPAPATITRKVLLNLLSLESRDCPDGGGSFSGMSSMSLDGGGPTIDLAVNYNAQKSVTLHGSVTDPVNNVGLTVTFSGSAVGATATDSTGHYTLTLNADSLGAVTARVTDSSSMTATAAVTLTSNVPSIGGLGYSTNGPGVYYLTGTVTDESAPGLTVKIVSGSDFTGWVNDGATVATNNTFQFRETAGANDPSSGWVYFQVTDWWGQTSATAAMRIN
jgi:hypothetical protein